MKKRFTKGDETMTEKLRPNYVGLKVCYDCKQIYDGRFEDRCPACKSDVWGNLRMFHTTDRGTMHINCKCLEK